MNGTELKPPMTPGIRLGGVSFVWRPWTALVTLVLAAAAFLLLCLSIGTGDFPISLSRVISTLFGGGEQVDRFVVLDLRMPRALAGLVVGVALGVSGAITQSIARNPLASPDILGITGGATLTTPDGGWRFAADPAGWTVTRVAPGSASRTRRTRCPARTGC